MRTRLVVDLRGLGERPLDALRLLLVADVHRRVLEDLRGGQVLLAILAGDAQTRDTLLAEARSLWIRDAAAHVATPDEAATQLGGPPDVLVRSGAPPPADAWPGLPRRWIAVGSFTTAAPLGAVPLASDLLRGRDPLALRLALLRCVPPHSGLLSAARLHRAEETLQRWRFKVAQWADMPWAPPESRSVAAMGDAFGKLDTVTVLTLLHRLEVDPVVTSGCKFETFAHVDRVLGLDLCHLVGKLRG